MSKKYINVSGNGANALKVEVYYHLGGYNVFTYKEEPRGYYLSVSPVEHSNVGGVEMESYTAFSGVKELLVEVKRKSKKQEENAENIAQERVENLVNYVCNKNGLTVTEV